MFEFLMTNEQLVEKIRKLFKKDKYDKILKIIISNKDNKELFDLLLNDEEFGFLLMVLFDRSGVLYKLNIDIQKKIIEKEGVLFRNASEELRNDYDYVKKVYEQIKNKEENDEKSRDLAIKFWEDSIGPKLLSNKNIMMEMKEEHPNVFFRAVRDEYITCTVEELKDFIIKNPSYLFYLSKYLDNDIDFIVEMIAQNDSMYLSLYAASMKFELLRNPRIKQAIIDISDIETYKKAIAITLDTEGSDDTLNNLKEDELRELLELDSMTFLDLASNDVKRHLNKQGKANIKLINDMRKMSLSNYRNVNTPEKLTDTLLKMAEIFGRTLPKEDILNKIKNNWEDIEEWIEVIKYNSETDNQKVIEYNSITFYTLYNLLTSIECNKIKEMSEILSTEFLKGSKYAAALKNIEITEDNKEFLKLIADCRIINSSNERIELFNKLFIKMNSLNNSPYESLIFISLLFDDNNLLELLEKVDVNSLSKTVLENIFFYKKIDILEKVESIDSLNNLQTIIEKEVKKYKKDNIYDYKKFLLLNYFQINLSFAREISFSYLSADKNSSLYTAIPNAGLLKEMFEKIINAQTIEELDQISNSLEKQNNKITINEIYKTVLDIKKMYGKEINSSLLQVNEKGIIDITDKNFKILLHVIGAYGTPPTGNVYESWNSKRKYGSISICTSFISDDNLGTARPKADSVILGFNNLDEDFLELMANYDLYSRGFSPGRKCKFFNSEELKNSTRHGHNELTIRRTKDVFQKEKLQPSYIICFDTINKNSKEAAEQFDIPILFIDREKVAKRHHDEIALMVEEFKLTKDPNLISKIICEQENNKSGLRLARPDLMEKFFGQKFRQDNIETLFNIISEELKKENKEIVPAMNIFVKAIEAEKEKYKIVNEAIERKNPFDLNCDEMLEQLKANPNYQKDFELPKELTMEELYTKFIEQRQLLAAQEKAELQAINTKQIEEHNSSSIKVG